MQVLHKKRSTFCIIKGGFLFVRLTWLIPAKMLSLSDFYATNCQNSQFLKIKEHIHLRLLYNSK